MALNTIKELNCKFCVLISIDAKNSFNATCDSFKINQLCEKRHSTYLVNFTSSFLKNRTLQIHKDTVIGTDAGVPQGSVLDPTLWNILYDGVLLINQLCERRISTYLVNFISSYLKNRKLLIHKDTVIGTDAGVPQASALGPTLWNILYDVVLSLELTRNAVTMGFADDLVLIVGTRSEHELVANTNTCLHK